MNNNSDDNNKDKADQANTSAHENKADKYASAKETLNKIIYKTGVLAGKAFAVAKAVTKDVVQELRNVNSIRKETVATAAEGTKKTKLAKTFWAKTSGKQRGIVLGLSALFVYISYSVLFKEESQVITPKTVSPPAQTVQTPATSTENKITRIEIHENNCLKITGISESAGRGIAKTYKVSYQTISFLNVNWKKTWFSKEPLCSITVDTGVGPKECVIDHVEEFFGGGIVTNGKSTWVHMGDSANYCLPR